MLVVLDTNVIVSALRSRKGASHQLVLKALTGELNIAVSNAILAEYEEVCTRADMGIALTPEQVSAIIDQLCAQAHKVSPYYRYRMVNDPDDAMVVELALACSADYVVTFNVKDFKAAEPHGLVTITPSELLPRL